MFAFKKILSWSTLSHLLYITLLLAIIVFTVFGDSGLYQLHSLHESRSRLKHQINETEARINMIEKEKALLTNPAYLESVIRKELGYIKDGEVIYQITPP